MIHEGDCLEVMPTLEAESVDAVVTDPPYGLGFMGKAWDTIGALESRPPSALHPAPGTAEARGAYPRTGKGPAAVAFDGRAFQVWCHSWATEAFRLAKPSAYLLAFGGTRTVHRMACAIEDAGWLIRDMLVWAYASGFPKSKASLKPAWEPIVMARKPGPLRELAIDATRIPMVDGDSEALAKSMSGSANWRRANQPGPAAVPIAGEYAVPSGRWPANVILTDPIFDGGWDGVVGGGEASTGGQSRHPGVFARDEIGSDEYTDGAWGMGPRDVFGYGDSGTYSRFFLIPKADRAEREPIWEAGLGLGRVIVKTQGRIEGRTVNPDGTITSHGDTRNPRANTHPTVKPLELMRHLVRLVTPTGGLVLDPFLGSGTTAIAAEMEGFRWIGIEREPEYVRIAEARLHGTQKGLGLPA